MSTRGLTIVAVLALLVTRALADEALYRYEGDALPYDESAGWLVFDPCDEQCSESLEDGHFVLRWSEPGNTANYDHLIAGSADPLPPSLWVEWRFRSNHPLGPVFTGCDGWFRVSYAGMDELVNMYGDASISESGDDFVLGLDIDEFHTYRYENLDGMNYRFSVDGLVFVVNAADSPSGSHFLQMAGLGGCTSDQIPNMKNEWDFIRFGTISFGERIIACDPPGGYLDPAVYSDLDRFTVTFDAANYVTIDDVNVEVSGGIAPTVIQTRRRETDDVDTVEIVLDRPLPLGERTRFIFDDGEVTNVLNYCLGLGPTCGDGCCNVDEDCTACPQDCDECGDGCCSATETACDCPDDCPANCGDGCCTHDETYINCPTDCEPIPATSAWGLLVLTLLTLITGTLILRSARTTTL